MIDRIDAENRLIYLDSSTVDSTIQPIDIYREMRTLRQNDETLRSYDVFMTMKGAEKKNPDGTKRTERYLVLLNGTMLVPYGTSHVLTVDGTIITDNGLEGVQCFNRAELPVGVEVDINYVPKQVEVITINTSGSTVDNDAIATAVWSNPKGVEVHSATTGGYRKDFTNNRIIMLNPDGTDGFAFNCYDKNDNPSLTQIDRMERV